MTSPQTTVQRVAIVGLSPGNSYFKRQTIDKVLRQTAQAFPRVYVMIPDHPAVHTYRALGYEEAKARRKARLSGNTLRNHCQRSLEEMAREGLQEQKVTLLHWEKDIQPNPDYEEAQKEMQALYKHNPEFQSAVNAETTRVLRGRSKTKADPAPKAITEGKEYLLKELAFLTASPKILTAKVTYCYHKEWHILQKLIRGEFDNKRREEIAFNLLT